MNADNPNARISTRIAIDYFDLRRMAKITGRSDDMLTIRGVTMFPSQLR